MQTRTAVRPRAAADGGWRVPLTVALMVSAALACAGPGLRPVSAALAGSWIATGTPAVGACDNAYFPVTLDIKREYRTSYANGGVRPVRHVETYRAISAESFTQRFEFADGAPASEQIWRCGGGGLISSQHGSGGAAGGRLRLETVRSDGVTIPNADEWHVGARWESRHEFRGIHVAAVAEKAQAGGTEGKIAIASEIIGEEAVSTPAGTFRAFKVRFTVEQDVSVARRGASFPMKASFTGFSWYARDVGLVKTIVTGLTTSELISFAR